MYFGGTTSRDQCGTIGVQGVTGAMASVRVSDVSAMKSYLNTTLVGSATEYMLPSPARWANGIASGGDGSVWFGEESVPGLAHLFANGTVIEYRWPGTYSGPPGDYKAGIWGVAIWKGMVWAADTDGNALVGIDPGSSRVSVINLTGKAEVPYTLEVSPAGDLWFTSLSSPAKVGKLGTDNCLSVYAIANLGREVPVEMQFGNSTSGYFVALDPYSSTGDGHAYAFDLASGRMKASPFGAGLTLYDPDSISVADGIAWIAQHGPSNIVSYNFTSGRWTVWPTSTVGYSTSTLPYFVEASGGKVWFNEHYGNRIGVIDPASRSLTEYSEADPPVSNLTEVHNDLTIATADGGLWFTSATGNYVGFVDPSRDAGFSMSLVGPRSKGTFPGGNVTFSLMISGTVAKALGGSFSDSEDQTSVPRLISSSLDGAYFSLENSSGSLNLEVTVWTSPDLLPGTYTLALTISDGLVIETAYATLDVV